MSFAYRLAEARKKLGLTQQSLADISGVHMMQIHRYEAGNSQPSLEVLKKLVVALRVSADQLLFEEDERGPDDEFKIQFEAVSKLAPEEKRIVAEVVESLLLKSDAKRWIKAGTSPPS